MTPVCESVLMDSLCEAIVMDPLRAGVQAECRSDSCAGDEPLVVTLLMIVFAVFVVLGRRS